MLNAILIGTLAGLPIAALIYVVGTTIERRGRQRYLEQMEREARAERFAFRAAAVVAFDRANLGDRRPCGGEPAAVKLGRYWASTNKASVAWGAYPA